MSPELINLHISQLSKAFDKTKTNKYADKRKDRYHESLIILFKEIQAKDVKSLKYNEQVEFKKILDFCFLSIEFLDNSTLVNIPHEIVYCLEKALSKWDNTDKYIIVTSLQNNLNSYSFNPKLALDETIYDIIIANYNITFDHRLIQISLPKYLARDYLANVVLYHELGHFIDIRHRLSLRIALNDKLSSEEFNHLGEFFSDVFAAQYIGFASNFYLEYIAHKNQDSISHPATDKRIKIVEDFLNSSTTNINLTKLQQVTKAVTGKELEFISDKINDSDFLNFVPSIIENEDQLHSVFEIGWDLWKKEIDEYNSNNIGLEEKYSIINNLIEKSISNYMITEEWPKDVPN